MATLGELRKAQAHRIIGRNGPQADRGHRGVERRPALARLLQEHAHDSVGQGGRAVGPELAQRLWRVEELFLHQLLDGFPLEGRPPGEHLVGDAPERILIREARRLAGPLLGTHVPRRSHRRPCGGQALSRADLGHAEVRDHRHPLDVDDDIRGLQIPMDHLTAVGVRQGSRRVVDDGLGGVDCEPPFVVENGVERATLDVLHDEEDNLRRLFEGEDRRDVPVAQRRGDPRFAPKPLDRRLTLQQGRRQDLDRDFLVEGNIVGQIDQSHAAAAEDALDVVFAERDALEIREQLGLGCNRHGRAAATAEAVAREDVRPAGWAGSY